MSKSKSFFSNGGSIWKHHALLNVSIHSIILVVEVVFAASAGTLCCCYLLFLHGHSTAKHSVPAIRRWWFHCTWRLLTNPSLTLYSVPYFFICRSLFYFPFLSIYDRVNSSRVDKIVFQLNWARWADLTAGNNDNNISELHRYGHYFILNHLDDVSLIISIQPFAQHNLSRPSARPSQSVPDRSHSTVILQTQNRNTANHTFKHYYFTIKSVHSYYNTELYLFIRKHCCCPTCVWLLPFYVAGCVLRWIWLWLGVGANEQRLPFKEASHPNITHNKTTVYPQASVWRDGEAQGGIGIGR